MYAWLAAFSFIGIVGLLLFEKNRHRAILLDTSVLIDGRIVEMVQLGFLTDQLIVATAVEQEINQLADSSDARIAQKAAKARQSILSLAENSSAFSIKNFTGFKTKSVDNLLIEIAISHRYKLLSTDVPMLAEAKSRGVHALSLNALAQALRLQVAVGQQLPVKLLFHGRSQGQAVGYLEDGTMVVVAGGLAYLGKTKSVTVTKVLQTASGRTIIARI